MRARVADVATPILDSLAHMEGELNGLATRAGSEGFELAIHIGTSTDETPCYRLALIRTIYAPALARPAPTPVPEDA